MHFTGVRKRIVPTRIVPALTLLLAACPSKAPEPSAESVTFEAEPTGETGAHARFELAGTPELEVLITDAQHGTLTYGGKTIDGDGALSADEEATLRSLAESALFPALAAIPLDAACDANKSYEPRVMAALLMPWQATLKYLERDRMKIVQERAAASKCRWFSSTDPNVAPDARPSPAHALLSNGQFIPAAFGYLPFDDQGILPGPSGQGLSIDTNVFGPGGSICRGACGADCEENNCGQPVEDYRCVVNEGHNTGEKQLWRRYTCGEHPGCIEHDACFDNCKFVFGVGSFESGICMRGCDLQAASGYGADQGIEWAQGHGPFTHEKSYDYSIGDPIRDEEQCPVQLTLVASPGSGLAPFNTTLRWDGIEVPGGPERCRLDFGDGTDPVTIENCPASGEQDHIYAVPSDMRYARGTYIATLTRIGEAITASAEVQANWLFDATTKNGKAPLPTVFTWQGFNLVSKPLACTIDFGDGTAPETLDNCALKPGMPHTYADVGVYQARITVRGEDRPVSKFLAIDVTEDQTPTDCSAIRGSTSWTMNASFSYSGSGSDGRNQITVDSSGMMQGTLTVATEGPGGVSFHSTSPSGVIHDHQLSIDLAPNADNPDYDINGNGDPVPPSAATDTGSALMFNVDLDNCLYNVHGQATVHATVQNGSHDTSEADVWVMSFQTAWLPLPAGASALSGGGNYAAHSVEYILTTQELIEYYAISNFDLVDVLGEGGLGAGTISWTLQRN